MAGGDLLYIFAFIILPTVVLVSCVWALILLRKGVLLPERPTRPDSMSESAAIADEEAITALDPVEETGEHTIVAPVASVPVATTPTTVDPTASAPATDTPPTAEPLADSPRVDDAPQIMPPDVEPPPAERTQELEAVPVEVSVVLDTDIDQTPSAGAPSEGAEPAVVPDDADATDASSKETPAASSVLIVPLDEPLLTLPAANQKATPETTVRVDDGPDNDQQDQPLASSPRRPARRITQLRPAEETSPRPRPRAGQRRNSRPPEGGG